MTADHTYPFPILIGTTWRCACTRGGTWMQPTLPAWPLTQRKTA